ncbi:MAG: hypothetical protein HZC26_02135 [Candidatus Magasanikbacteria bacterium]|nr:hypothetical protein [Candidatus Magasanikbacteria bacterium]
MEKNTQVPYNAEWFGAMFLFLRGLSFPEGSAFVDQRDQLVQFMEEMAAAQKDLEDVRRQAGGRIYHPINVVYAARENIGSLWGWFRRSSVSQIHSKRDVVDP